MSEPSFMIVFFYCLHLIWLVLVSHVIYGFHPKKFTYVHPVITYIIYSWQWLVCSRVCIWQVLPVEKKVIFPSEWRLMNWYTSLILLPQTISLWYYYQENERPCFSDIISSEAETAGCPVSRVAFFFLLLFRYSVSTSCIWSESLEYIWKSIFKQ